LVEKPCCINSSQPDLADWDQLSRDNIAFRLFIYIKSSWEHGMGLQSSELKYKLKGEDCLLSLALGS